MSRGIFDGRYNSGRKIEIILACIVFAGLGFSFAKNGHPIV